MEIKREKYLKALTNRMHNGMIKVITGIKRCEKSYLIFKIFKNYLKEIHISDNHIIEIALDERKNRITSEPSAPPQPFRKPFEIDSTDARNKPK